MTNSPLTLRTMVVLTAAGWYVLAYGAASPDTANLTPAQVVSRAALHEINETLEQETGRAFKAAAASPVCSSGRQHERFASPAEACRIAHDYAYEMHQYDVARAHATLGCQTYRDSVSCELAAKLARIPEMGAHRSTSGLSRQKP